MIAFKRKWSIVRNGSENREKTQQNNSYLKTPQKMWLLEWQLCGDEGILFVLDRVGIMWVSIYFYVREVWKFVWEPKTEIERKRKKHVQKRCGSQKCTKRTIFSLLFITAQLVDNFIGI